MHVIRQSASVTRHARSQLIGLAAVILCFGCGASSEREPDRELKLGAITRQIPGSPHFDNSQPANFPIHEVNDRFIYRNEVVRHFLNGEFYALEKMAADARPQNSVTPSGTHKLDLFYDAFLQPTLTSELGLSDQVASLMQNWENEIPESPTRRIVYAKYLVNIAWHRRGGAYVNETSPNQFAAMRATFREAADYLQTMPELGDIDPAYYDALIEISAQIDSAENYWAMIDTALEKYPYYMPLYRTMVHFATPLWGGDITNVEVIAQIATELNPDQKTSYYARVYWAAIFRDSTVRKWVADGNNWPELRTAFYDLVELYPDLHNAYTFLGFSCLVGDEKTARRLHGEVTTHAPMYNVWEQQNVSHCKESGFAGRIEAEMAAVKQAEQVSQL